MCDTIKLQDGTEIESINQDGSCLCTNTQTEILSWIIERTPPLEIGDRLVIEHVPFGWNVNIETIDCGGDCRTTQH